MTGRVLVVDDIFANVKLLEARLSAEYFDVLTAYSGPEALELMEVERVDVVLLDVMMPGLDGFEVCRRIKSSPKTMHVPVVMVTALDQSVDKVQGLEAGADDFLTKPVDDIALITRVKNLARLKTLNDEMLLRMATGAEIGVLTGGVCGALGTETGGCVLLVEDQYRVAERMRGILAKSHEVDIEPGPQTALLRLADKPYDVVIVSLNLAGADGLRLCSQVRAIERTRHLPIIVLAQPGEEARLLRALDMGVNDYVTRPIDRNELLARVRTQVKRKRHSDHLRGRLEETVELALTDALTGLHNRRYMETHLKALVEQAREGGRLLSLLFADVDNFKAINDGHGHDAGDNVLRELAQRLRRNIRNIDLVARVGGEEFVIVMPDTGMERALQVGERLRSAIASEPIRANSATHLGVTASVGIATLDGQHDSAEGLLKRADQALYVAKRGGRNRVVADAA
jgi:two-component system cell cycle response regulator